MEGDKVKPILEFRMPRLYIFIIVMVALFSVLNVAILFYGRNLFIYYSAIWSWSIILLVALAGAMLIGMAMSHRLFTYREFTPFERDMMEMRVEVDELKRMITDIHAHLKKAEDMVEGTEEDPGSPGEGTNDDS
jgi:small-conductance mechanosensitive channel